MLRALVFFAIALLAVAQALLIENLREDVARGAFAASAPSQGPVLASLALALIITSLALLLWVWPAKK